VFIFWSNVLTLYCHNLQSSICCLHFSPNVFWILSNFFLSCRLQFTKLANQMNTEGTLLRFLLRFSLTKLTPHSTFLLGKLLVLRLAKKIPHILCNPKVHYRFHNSSLLANILIKMNKIHAISSYFCKIQLNISLQSTLRFSKWFLTFRFPNLNPAGISLLSHNCVMPYSSYPLWFFLSL
jgi:hypothetical protein